MASRRSELDSHHHMQARISHTPLGKRYTCIPWPSAASRSSAFGATLARARRTARDKRAQGVLANRPPAPLGSPPPEVQRELAAAALASQRLAAQGKEVRFVTSADGRRVSVELTDAAGHPLDVIGPSALFQLLKQPD
jgi:hypothetical protein